MDNQRLAATIAIRAQVLKTEHATNNAAEENARLLAIMLNKRGELACPLSVGGNEVDRAHQALTRTLSSMRSLAIMHRGLHVVADEGDGSSGYGPSETMPNKPGGFLRVA